MIEKTKAIVLRSVKYGDSQLIVDFFTESHGRLSFMVNVPKSSKGKLKRQFFQSLMLLNIEFDYRPKLSLQKLKNVRIAFPYSDIPFSPVKISLAIFLAEFLSYATKLEQANSPLFEFLWQSFVWLDQESGEIANFHVLFLCRLSYFLGLGPNLDVDTENMWFDLEEGCFVPYSPTHSHFLSQVDSRHLLQLFRLRYKTMHLYPMSRQDRNHCVEVIVEYYRLHLPSFPELKSLPVLKELFC